jgi:hypothetical protein
MATRRSNVGNINIIPNNDVLLSNNKLPKKITNLTSSNKQNDGPYSNSKQKNRHQHRLISHRVIMTIVLIIFVIITAVSTISFIVKIKSNISATKQDTILSRFRTEQSLLNDTVPEIIVPLKVAGGGIGGAGSRITGDNDDNNKDNNDKNQSNTNVNSARTNEKPMEIHLTFHDPPIYEAPIIDQTILDFDYPTTTSINNDAVIVTKIQGPPHLRALRQMLCLLTKAYNNRVQHDIIVFTSELIEQSDIDELQMIVSPAKLIVEIDNPGLQNMVNDLSDSQRKHLFERCGTNITSSSELSWYTECTEVRSYKTLKGERIAYNWQAEFRALWLWIHPLLKPYKYMM